MHKYRMFMARDIRDNQNSIWVIRNECEAAQFKAATHPARIKIAVARGAAVFMDLQHVARHIDQAQVKLHEWEMSV